MIQRQEFNVLGNSLASCCSDPMTGFFRDGSCRTGEDDHGRHTVCARMTQEFLEFSRARGNDLMTPMPDYGFPGLKAGDCWCLCVLRWKEALDAGFAPLVRLESCHSSVLDHVTLEQLQAHTLAG
ncbi:MAG: hypothetical protein ACJA2W_000768 [Planctomycetota bacterium]|jgi:uncharacterized protein (DUF2237 family)